MKRVFTVAAFVVVVLVSGCCATTHTEATEYHRKLAAAFQKEQGECIPRSWLLEELSEEAIASIRDMTPEVLRMIQNRRLGDKVFRYRSPPETWAALLGQAGFAIVRDGRPVDCVITIIN
jgi:hypothetical protein